MFLGVELRLRSRRSNNLRCLSWIANELDNFFRQVDLVIFMDISVLKKCLESYNLSFTNINNFYNYDVLKNFKKKYKLPLNSFVFDWDKVRFSNSSLIYELLIWILCFDFSKVDVNVLDLAEQEYVQINKDAFHLFIFFLILKKRIRMMVSVMYLNHL